MKSRILSIVLAISLIAVLFAALPTTAAVNYTGSVVTTDSAGAARVDFIQGEPVYVDVNVLLNGAPANVNIYVSLVRTTGGGSVSNFNNQSADPVVGWYNSSTSNPHRSLSTNAFINGDVQSYYVIVTQGGLGGTEIARTQIVVHKVGLTLTPAPNQPAYWPGEQVTMTLVVSNNAPNPHTGQVFYVQVVNDTYEETGINFTGKSAPAGYWSDSFQIAASMPDGVYHIRVRPQSLTDTSVWENMSFNVQAFDFTVTSNRYAYLPGETALITYNIKDLATLAPITSGFTINYSVEYQNKTGNLTWLNGTLDVSQNLWEFTLPTNGTSKTSIALYSNLDLTFTAKETGRSGDVEENLFFTIGMITPSVSVDQSSYIPGDTVVVTVSASVNGWSLDGARVDVTVAKNGTEVVDAYGMTNLTTNNYGQATYLFKLAVTSDLMSWNYVVKATVTKVGYSAVRETQFSVGPSNDLTVELDQNYYYGGQEATATFKALVNNLPVDSINIGYKFQLGPTILLVGNTTGTSASVSIPETSYGTLQVTASAHMNGKVIDDTDSAAVVFALIGLSPRSDVYRAGETLVFQWTIVTGQASADLAYEIMDADGVRVANGTPTFSKTGSFEFDVPAAGPLLSDSYEATLRMTTPEGGFASADAAVDLVDSGSGSNMELKIWVSKSPYTSGEFAPGQKLTIHYELAAYVKAAPASIRLEMSVDADPSTYNFIVDSPTGTITYRILKDAPSAPLEVDMDAYDAANPMAPSLASALTVFWVNNQVSAWDSSIGGMSAIDLVLLILLIVVIIMLIVVPYMKDRMARPKPPETKPMELTPPPPSEPGKTPPSP